MPCSAVPFAVTSSAAALPGEAQQRNITWTAGQVGGGWYAQAGGFSELIKSKDPSFNIKVIPGAGIQNMTKLQQAETELAWGLPPFIVASYQGQDPYKEKHGDMRLVMNVSDRIHVLANGRTLAEGTAAEVRSNPAVVEAYLGLHGTQEAARAFG